MSHNQYEQSHHYGLDLLKIICVFMVLILHYFNNYFDGMVKYYNDTLYHFVMSFCCVAVNCFILITGYFMVDKQCIRINKIINILFQLVFYSTIIYSVCLIFSIVSFDTTSFQIFLYNIFHKWFIIVYLIMYYILSLYINILIKNIYQR